MCGGWRVVDVVEKEMKIHKRGELEKNKTKTGICECELLWVKVKALTLIAYYGIYTVTDTQVYKLLNYACKLSH